MLFSLTFVLPFQFYTDFPFNILMTLKDKYLLFMSLSKINFNQGQSLLATLWQFWGKLGICAQILSDKTMEYDICTSQIDTIDNTIHIHLYQMMIKKVTTSSE